MYEFSGTGAPVRAQESQAGCQGPMLREGHIHTASSWLSASKATQVPIPSCGQVTYSVTAFIYSILFLKSAISLL